jgi:hypothetical protein
MDAFVQLALMAKAKLVFEAEDTFLSFPALSPLSYPADELKLSREGIASARDLARLSEFARITNQVPRGTIAPIDEGEYLWDICNEVLALGEPASGSLSDAEQARLSAARALLYTASATGGRQEAPALTAYKQCRDAYIVALEEYRNQQVTAESTSDPAEKARWTTADEPRLRQVVTAAEEDWRTRGSKTRIEEAMQIEQACAARQPSAAWEAWKSDFIGDIDLATDTERIRFAPTVFTPNQVFDEPWPRFTLTGAEMARLSANAPRELLDIFDATAAGSDIESVSFEYRSVALVRSWLPKRLFQSRFWRLGRAGAGGELSDGQNPPQGRCPAYITALVFARNVTVRRRQPAGAAQPTRIPPKALVAIDAAQVRPDSTQLRLARQAPAGRMAAASPVTPLRQPAAAADTRVIARAIDRPRIDAAVLREPAIIRPMRPFQPAVLRYVPVAESAAPPPVAEPTPVPSPSPPQSETQDEISILAFVCRRVPRCPDPDPSLAWS